MTVAKYGVGFVLSLLLTIAAYMLAVGDWKPSWILVILGVLAIVQMIVQLIFFLHLSDESRPRYKLAAFVFMAGSLTIIIVGSLWIMENMNYNMTEMTPTQKNSYMMIQHDKGF